jgi:DNA (cytosine-5)-methyltransferase 1
MVEITQVNFYNDNDPYVCAWLRNLIAAGQIPDGYVHEGSICDIDPNELRGFRQHHFFAGIGGWPYALQLAEWPEDREVWTGSCPCQSFSSAARGRNVAEDLWPAWSRLIAEYKPGVVFGEQVAQSDSWIDRVCDDLEALGYACAASILPACSIGFDHTRSRIYFVGHADGKSKSGVQINEEMGGLSKYRSITGSMVPQDGVFARVAKLRAFGNAIVPPLAAEFIKAFLETTSQ